MSMKIIGGKPFPWRMLESNLQGVRNFHVRDDDIFIICYPKSGMLIYLSSYFKNNLIKYSEASFE